MGLEVGRVGQDRQALGLGWGNGCLVVRRLFTKLWGTPRTCYAAPTVSPRLVGCPRI